MFRFWSFTWGFACGNYTRIANVAPHSATAPIWGQPIEDGKRVDDVCVGLLFKRRGIGEGRGIDWIKRHGMSHVVSSVL